MKKSLLVICVALASIAIVSCNNCIEPKGEFSVSADRKVCFSRGNLQYQASTGIWRFAEHQYDYIGSDNCNISSDYEGWIDLFGWGTGNNPTNNSTYDYDYIEFKDWGNNTVSNGGGRSGEWRVLTTEEWNYLIENRANAKQLYGAAQIEGVNGFVFLPDDWKLPAGSSFISGNSIYRQNSYSSDQWKQMENAGAIFLPTAGSRKGSIVYGDNFEGNYWSGSVWRGCVDFFEISRGDVDTHHTDMYSKGMSVRLVREQR